MSRYTQWFPRDVKPARVGVYKRRLPYFGCVFALWDGYGWRSGHKSKQLALRETQMSLYPERPWQGLRKKS